MFLASYAHLINTTFFDLVVEQPTQFPKFVSEDNLPRLVG